MSTDSPLDCIPARSDPLFRKQSDPDKGTLALFQALLLSHNDLFSIFIHIENR